jgi:uncharacterized YigZ family protein
MARYPIPAKQTRTEINVKNSRFIATAAPAFSVDEAKAFIAAIKAEFSDATHNVPAFLIGYGPSTIAHCSDDGEPSGTAGRPVLTVLQGSGLGDIAVVVTRYFGGTKLGTGGLVRAYTDAAKAVLAVPYHLYEQVKLLVGHSNGRVLDETFAADITMTIQFTTTNLPQFQNSLRELSHGTLQAEIIETNEETIMPIGTFPTK